MEERIIELAEDMRCVMENADRFLEMGFADESLMRVLSHSSRMMSMMRGDAAFSDPAESDDIHGFLLSLLGGFPGFTFMSEEEVLLESLRNECRELWESVGAMTETLWVGGLLYSEEIRSMMADIMRPAGKAAVMLGSVDVPERPYGLDWHQYFSGKYDIYYDVYEKAGTEGLFAPIGQKNLAELAVHLHEREEFFEAFLEGVDAMGDDFIPSEIGDMLASFPGPDRRVEILRQLSREKEMTYGSFSTFDPSRTMKHLISEIRSDCYGGVYVPPGENAEMYECIVPQLRARWLREHCIG